MRFKKIALIIPAQEYYYPEYPHGGMGYLSEWLTNNGIDNYTFDMRLGYSIEETVKKIKNFNPDLVAITLTTYSRDVGYKVVGRMKKEGYTVFVGGPHVSLIKKETLNECSADFGVILEGEYPLIELCQGKESSEIKNLIYRNGKNIIMNEPRPFIFDLDVFPFPKHEKCEFDKYKNTSICLVTSRGCPYHCTFCSVKVSAGMPFRKRSPNHILEEIKYWHDRGHKYFHIIDDNFTLHKNRVIEISNKIRDSGIKVTLACDGVRADMVDREVLMAMKEAGFRYVSFGVEGGNNKVLSIMKKGETIEQIEESIKISCELGFDVYLFFLIGSIGETMKDVEDSIKLTLKYPIAGCNFYNVVPYPGTELYDYVKKNNLFIIQPKDYIGEVPYYGDDPIFETPEFTAEERKLALKKTRKVREIIRRRALKRRLSRLGIFGKISYLFLRYDFIKEEIVKKKLVKIAPLRNIISKKTEEIFVGG